MGRLGRKRRSPAAGATNTALENDRQQQKQLRRDDLRALREVKKMKAAVVAEGKYVCTAASSTSCKLTARAYCAAEEINAVKKSGWQSIQVPAVRDLAVGDGEPVPVKRSQSSHAVFWQFMDRAFITKHWELCRDRLRPSHTVTDVSLYIASEVAMMAYGRGTIQAYFSAENTETVERHLESSKLNELRRAVAGLLPRHIAELAECSTPGFAQVPSWGLMSHSMNA